MANSDEISPTYACENIGTYTVSLEVISPLGQTDTIWNNLITRVQAPLPISPTRRHNPVTCNQLPVFTDQSPLML
ncbi:MAG: hypothetical protein IPN76_35040 [Saprospiraceae bacterium]|nr:hypothetical protein [Saprospiraceae bacterium]